MTCDMVVADENKVLFKYQDRLLMKDLAYGRIEGKWIDACDALDTLVGVATNPVRRFVTTEDRAVVCLYKYDRKGWSSERKTILDFEAKTTSNYVDGRLSSFWWLEATGSCN